MPRVSNPTFRTPLKELDTEQGSMNVVIQGVGGYYTYFFNKEKEGFAATMEKLHRWFLNYEPYDLDEAVPGLTAEERQLILAGKAKS